MSSFEKKFDHLKRPLIDIQTATNNFADENIVRRDGFGNEYKGQLVLSSGELINILARRLDPKMGHGIKEFQTEIMMLASLKHQNLASIVGFCDEDGEKIIINKFEAKGSLHQYLSDPVTLTWNQRLKICLGIARALSYIHYDNQRSFSVIHRDVKSSKILLSDKWEGKLSGFELSIMQPAAKRLGLVLDEPCGTHGYCDPAYIASATVNHKSDVYSFGVVLFEVLSGEIGLISNNNRVSLAILAKSHYEDGTLSDIIHPGLQNQMDSQALKILSEAAYSCLTEQRSQRPDIDMVIFAIEEALKFQLACENSIIMSSFDQKFDYIKLPLKDIQTATNNFADDNIVRRDGFGNEYRGQLLLSTGNLIHIIARRLDTKITGHGSEEFQAEITMLSCLKHQNLVTFVGFCDENDEKIIINRFEARLSLDRYLSDPVTLTWTQRLEICLGIAHALGYIHYDEGRDFSIIHRDIKSSKVLLDDKWEAKLSGFELSTTQPATQRHDLLRDLPCGTRGYVDPTYEASGGVTLKSDVYSFGVVLFEVLSGRIASIPNNNGVLLAKSAQSHYENRTLNDIIHPGLQDQMASQALKAFSEAAYSCLNEQQSQRPNIDQVIFALDQTLQLQLAYENSGKSLEHLKIRLEDILIATNNFSKDYCIGSGGFGYVYKAELEHFDSFAMKGNKASELPKRRSTVAIKRIFNVGDGEGKQMLITEIETLARCRHPNLVSLLGFCHEAREMILVYEYVSYGNLADYIMSRKTDNLTWVQRIKICIDIARALDYLHTAMKYKQMIIHRDIKSSNILLDDKQMAKISDFGLSKSLTHKENTIITEIIAGTSIYMDPEYMSTGMLRKESDVYSFGVVLFEILTGRLAYDPVYMNDNENGLAPIVRQHFKRGTLKELVDPKLLEERDENIYTPSRGPNEDSLRTFYEIGYQCLAETQAQRPSMKDVIHELYKALYFQKFPSSLQISFEDIKKATKDFNITNLAGIGGFGRAYRGELLLGDEPSHIVAKRNDTALGQGEVEFFTEIEILFEYKHENIISLVGYCKKENERILVYEYASNGSLNRYVKHASLTWTKRLQICIDVAKGLEYIHRGSSPQAPVIHRDLKSNNILLDSNWKAKIGDFGLSIITPKNNKFDVMFDTARGTFGYVDPLYLKQGLLSRESDIYSLGVVLLEMMCGRIQDPHNNLVDLVKKYCKEGKVDELVFEGIKDKIVRKSLIAFVNIACECLHDEREKRPTASKVVLQLKEALKFQLDGEC